MDLLWQQNLIAHEAFGVLKCFAQTEQCPPSLRALAHDLESRMNTAGGALTMPPLCAAKVLASQ